jgi:probable addiction module antidote protein
MNREQALKHTTSFKADLLEDLKDPEFAQHYLEAALDDYDEDGDTESLLLAMRDVAEAQGGVRELSKRVGVTREHLYKVLSSKHNPQLNNLLSIVAGLGFRVRLEPRDVAAEQTAAPQSVEA